jgi:hypothetical protein
MPEERIFMTSVTVMDTIPHKLLQEIVLIVIVVKLYFILPICVDCALSLGGENKHFQNLLY